MSLQRAQDAHEKALADLTDLTTELPNFERLLTEAQTEADRLRSERAAPQEQAAALGRVNVAKALLEQHHADIQTAQTALDRARETLKHEETLDQMAQHASAASQHRETFEHTLLEANTALLEYVAALATASEGLESERRAFLDAGRSVAQAFAVTGWPRSWEPQRIEAEEQRGDTLLTELEARGVDPEAALVGLGQHRHTVLEPTHPRPLAHPEPFGRLLYDALRLYLKHQAEAQRGGGQH